MHPSATKAAGNPSLPQPGRRRTSRLNAPGPGVLTDGPAGADDAVPATWERPEVACARACFMAVYGQPAAAAEDVDDPAAVAPAMSPGISAAVEAMEADAAAITWDPPGCGGALVGLRDTLPWLPLWAGVAVRMARPGLSVAGWRW